LARAVYDRATALAAASVLAVSPLFWFYGSVGLTYAGEALFASSVAYFAFRALDGGEADAWLAAAYLALAAGMRQSLLLLLLPMCLVACVLGVRRARTVPVGVAILGVLTLLWFVPMVALTGGLGRSPAAPAPPAHPVLRPLGVLLGRVVITAFAEAAALARRRALGPALTAAAVVLVVLVNGAFFVNARPLPRDFDTPRPAWRLAAEHEAFDWIFSRTAAALREHEEVVRTFVEAIRGLYPAEETVVITELGNTRSYPWLRHAMFYLPEYSIFELRVGELPPGYYAPQLASDMLPWPDSDIRLPARTRRLVWFVDHWAPSVARPAGLVEIELPYGRFLYTLPIDRRPVAYAGYTLVRDR